MISAVMATALRMEVLRSYRRILKACRVWEAEPACNTAAERAYIKQEARTIFRRNKHVSY